MIFFENGWAFTSVPSLSFRYIYKGISLPLSGGGLTPAPQSHTLIQAMATAHTFSSVNFLASVSPC